MKTLLEIFAYFSLCGILLLAFLVYVYTRR
jgi:hypothetical protein